MIDTCFDTHVKFVLLILQSINCNRVTRSTYISYCLTATNCRPPASLHSLGISQKTVSEIGMNQYSSITESSSDDVISHSMSQSSDRLVEKRKEKLTKEQILSRYNIFDIARKIQHPQTGFEVSDRSSVGRVYRNSFIAKDAVQWLIQHLKLSDSQEAVVWGQRLQECGFIAPVNPNKTFKDKSVLFRFSAVVPRQVFKSSIFLSRGNSNSRGSSGQNTPQASPRGSIRLTPLAPLSTTVWPNIPEYLFDKYNSYRTTKLLDKGYFFTSYSNTGTIVVGNVYNSEQLVYVYNKSPLISAVVQFPRIITAHENNTLQVYDVTEPEEVVRYRIEDFVQRSRDKLEALVLDNMHLVLITQRQCFMFYLRDLTHEPHTTVDIELVNQFREYFSALSYPYLLLGGSMTFKVYHVVSNTLVFEGKCIPPMLSFLEMKICGTTVVTNSSNSIAIWKINESLSAQNPIVKQPQVLVSSLGVYEDYVIAGDIKGHLRLLQCSDGSPVNVLGRSKSPSKYRKSATSNRPRSATLAESVTDLKFDRKINAIHRQDDHVFAVHQDNKITVWDLADIGEDSKPKERFALPNTAKEMSVTWTNDVQGGSIAIYSKGMEERYKSHPNGVVSFAVLKV